MNVAAFAVELGAVVRGQMADQVATVDKLLVAHLTPHIILHPGQELTQLK